MWSMGELRGRDVSVFLLLETEFSLFVSGFLAAILALVSI
jgi:hypothetical protein